MQGLAVYNWGRGGERRGEGVKYRLTGQTSAHGPLNRRGGAGTGRLGWIWDRDPTIARGRGRTWSPQARRTRYSHGFLPYVEQKLRAALLAKM